jgi:hypothetical protein
MVDLQFKQNAAYVVLDGFLLYHKADSDVPIPKPFRQEFQNFAFPRCEFRETLVSLVFRVRQASELPDDPADQTGMQDASGSYASHAERTRQELSSRRLTVAVARQDRLM